MLARLAESENETNADSQYAYPEFRLLSMLTPPSNTVNTCL